MISTFSGWNFGHTIKLDNKYLNFEEVGGSGELAAILNDGSYSLQEFATECIRAMNDAAEINKYTFTLDRDTRKITVISDSANFSLLITSGEQFELSVFTLMGFTGADLSGAQNYEGDSASGSQFIPQLKLQDYVPFEDLETTANASTNENTKGDVIEVINYGEINRMECNILFSTNITPQRAIRNDPLGRDKLRDFMKYLRTKGKTEFMEDVNTPSVFEKCILDKTRLDRKGLGFKLIDMKNVGWTNYFTTDPLEFRKVK